jgi:signal transduction histidine kinase
MIDLSEIRVEQAKTLKRDSGRSALNVAMVVFYITILLLADGRFEVAALWSGVTVGMIGLTLIYARYVAPDGITLQNYKTYLRGHSVVTFCTGLIWGTFSIIVVEYDSFFSMFVAFSIATSITIGGMFPGNSYRPAYIALAVPTVLMLGFHFLIFAPEPTRYFGFGLLFFFIFALLSSAGAELATRDQVVTRNQQKLTEAIMAHSVEVKEAYDSKANFLATASHDLSQPLHAQGHYIEALRQSSTSPEQREIIEKISQSWRAQKEMLGNLVNAMRLDGGMIKPRFVEFDLVDLLEELLSGLTLEAKRKKIIVQADLPHALPVISDPVFLRRILSNALSNVIRHAASGKSLEVEAEQRKGEIEIRIIDQGEGFDRDGNLFENLDEISKGGVGLSSILNLSKLIDATPSLSNQPASAGVTGAIFTLRLPEEPVDTLRATQREPLSANSVMIIDDDRTILNAVTVLFTQWGVQTLSAASVEEALAMLDATQMSLDLMIVDNRLSDQTDSVAAIQAIRKQTGRELPAVVVSGDVTAPDKLSGLDHVDILPKPVEASDFRPFFQ